jgi:hypothetical protein
MHDKEKAKALYRAVLRPEWGDIESFLREERERHVSALIRAGDEQTSDRLRGRIAELDTLLALPDQARQFRKDNS